MKLWIETDLKNNGSITLYCVETDNISRINLEKRKDNTYEVSVRVYSDHVDNVAFQINTENIYVARSAYCRIKQSLLLKRDLVDLKSESFRGI